MPDPGTVADKLALSTSRRGFLGRMSRLLMFAAGGGAVTALVKPGEADAYHFCGHVYTTDSCPHPTGLPRVDAQGFPLRARDGKPIDDLGRPIGADGGPIDDSGEPLLDPDGRPLPPAPRTRLCVDAVSAEFEMHTWVDGSWYRCCWGHVRKLIDCCSRNGRRINGDAALTGYCYAGRRVFCVMYYDTKIPC
jgi:hypothetical protein